MNRESGSPNSADSTGISQGYDRLAKIYDTLLLLGFGMVERAQKSLLSRLPAPAHVLILGEGTGNFLKELHKRFPESEKTVIELSPEMIRQAQKKIDHPKIHWINACIFTWQGAPSKRYDLLCANFFFDQFTPAQIKETLNRYQKFLTPEALLYFSDFTPGGGLASRLLVSFLYFFFKKTAKIKASRLPDTPKIFHEAGFSLIEQKKFLFSIQTLLYKRKTL